jgi:hypothetical protein
MSTNLEAMALAAESIDAETEATEPGAILAQKEGEAAIDATAENAGHVKMILDLAVPIIGAMYPSLNDIYTEQAKISISAALSPVLTKYNIRLSDWGAAYKEEIGAIIVIGPILYATVQAVKSDVLEREKLSPKEPVRAALDKAVKIDESVSLG